jgi:hypothetical protein
MASTLFWFLARHGMAWHSIPPAYHFVSHLSIPHTTDDSFPSSVFDMTSMMVRNHDLRQSQAHRKEHSIRKEAKIHLVLPYIPCPPPHRFFQSPNPKTPYLFNAFTFFACS